MTRTRVRARARRVAIVLALGLALELASFAPTIMAASAPPNDFFAFATQVAALPYTDAGVDNTLAGKEPGEPLPSCSGPGSSLGSYGNSVWYRFTAAADTTLSAAMLPANTVSNRIYPILSAYRGASLASLVDLGCSSASNYNAAVHLAFQVAAGQTYYVRAASDTNYSSGGVFTFSLSAPSSVAWAPTTSALGNTTSGPFSFATKIQSRGGYITWRVDGGTAVAGKVLEVWVYKKYTAYGKWYGPTLLTTRRANADGVAYLNIRSGGVLWISLRAKLPASGTQAASWGPTSIGRWR